MLKSALRSLGRALRPIRPGVMALTSSKYSGFLGYAIRVTSPAFEEGRPMPARFTADGGNRFPPLAWEGLPPLTMSVVLLVEDADSPSFRPLTHLILHSVPADVASLAEGEIPLRLVGASRRGYACGRNAVGRPGWMAPSPPPGHGPHHYAFQVFALNAKPRYPHPPGRSLLLRTIRPYVIGQGRLIGTYERA